MKNYKEEKTCKKCGGPIRTNNSVTGLCVKCSRRSKGVCSVCKGYAEKGYTCQKCRDALKTQQAARKLYRAQEPHPLLEERIEALAKRAELGLPLFGD